MTAAPLSRWWFARQGFLYGLPMGALVGTAIVPVFGTIFGVIVGPLIGWISGIVIDLLRVYTPVFSFAEEADLSAVRRSFSVRVGMLIFALVTIAGIVLSTRNIRGFDMGVMLLSLYIAPWSSITMASAARRYPVWTLRHKAKRDQVPDEADTTPSQSEIWPMFRRLYQCGSALRRWAIGVLFPIGFMLDRISRNPVYFKPEAVAANLLLGILFTEVIWAYIVFMNSMVLTTARQMILREYVPNISSTLSRRLLTGLSFLITLLVTWWTVVFAPVITIYTAYYVYHSIATDEPPAEKTKHKTKHTLALEDDISREESVLVNEQEPVNDLRSR